MLYDMRDLSEILARKRYREGSIDFDVAETQILVDEEGDVVSRNLQSGGPPIRSSKNLC